MTAKPQQQHQRQAQSTNPHDAGADTTMVDSNLIARSTLSLLDLRLSRIEHLLTGSSSPSTPALSSTNASVKENPAPNVPNQLHILEKRLTALKRLDDLPGSLVRMVDSLRREYPELFVPQQGSSSLHETTTSVAPYELSQRAHQVLASSTVFTTASAQLQTLQTLKIPPAKQSADLINSASRVEELRVRQEKLDDEVEELQSRSAGVLEWWVKNGVVGMGELWEDWEGRVRDCEKITRREDRAARERSGEMG